MDVIPHKPAGKISHRDVQSVPQRKSRPPLALLQNSEQLCALAGGQVIFSSIPITALLPAHYISYIDCVLLQGRPKSELLFLGRPHPAPLLVHALPDEDLRGHCEFQRGVEADLCLPK